MIDGMQSRNKGIPNAVIQKRRTFASSLRILCRRVAAMNMYEY